MPTGCLFVIVLVKLFKILCKCIFPALLQLHKVGGNFGKSNGMRNRLNEKAEQIEKNKLDEFLLHILFAIPLFIYEHNIV